MAESAGTLSAPTAKVPRQDSNWKHCLCHGRQVSGELTPFTPAIELAKASRISGTEPRWCSRAAHWDEGPAGASHCPCYQTYIKTLIKRLQDERERGSGTSEQASTSAQADSGTNKRGSRSSTPTPRENIVASSVTRHGVGQGENVKHWYNVWLPRQARNY